MKEKQEEDTNKELLNEDFINEDEKISKEMDVDIFDYNTKKFEKYKLLNENEELLLCKEENIQNYLSKKDNQEDDIKIKELYKGEEDDSTFYLNKKEIKQKLSKSEINLEEEEDENSLLNFLDNKNDKEMQKLYEEVQLKHPRKIVDGKISRYSFISWSGFFCCNKSEYFSLGQGYTTYFNTIKILIMLFLILLIINIHSMKLCSNYETVFPSFKDHSLLKTTLGNTIISYFNSTFIFVNATNLTITYDCGENILDKIICIRRYYGVKKSDFFIKPGQNNTKLDDLFDIYFSPKY